MASKMLMTTLLLMMKWRTCCLCDLSACVLVFFSKLFFSLQTSLLSFHPVSPFYYCSRFSQKSTWFQNQTKTQSIMSTKSSSPSSSSSSSSQVYNKNHSAIKRLMSEIQELQRNPSPDYTAQPLEDNLFEWHFTVRGPPDTAFQDGIYHGRIILPSDYPFKPPDIMLLTPNGRFETNKKICLSVSSHHPESWMPAWGIRTVLLALIGFMPTEAKGIGAIDYSDEARRELAKRSVNYHCETCGCHNRNALPAITTAPTSSSSSSGSSDSDATVVVDNGENDMNVKVNENDEKSGDQAEEKQQTPEMNESDDRGSDGEKRSNDDIQELNDATMTTRTISDHSSETIRTEKTDEERTTIPTEAAATTTTRRVVSNDMTNSAVAQQQQQQSSSSPSSSTTRQRQNSSARTTRSVVVAKNDTPSSFNSGLLFLNLLIFLVAMGVGFVMYHKMTHFDHYREL